MQLISRNIIMHHIYKFPNLKLGSDFIIDAVTLVKMFGKLIAVKDGHLTCLTVLCSVNVKDGQTRCGHRKTRAVE